MSETASNVVTYTPLESGNEESRWIRLEQVQATLPGPPVAAVAGMLDALYDLEPCDDGMGGGGDEADEENEPSAEAVEEELSILLKAHGQCNQGWWLAAINVYRTHRQPEYELRSETALVETVEPVTASYLQVVEVAGPLIALDRPYAGGLSGIPKGVKWEVRGATVNLDLPVHDRLTLRYQTWYEHVTLRVPTKKTDDGEEYEPAAVVAFWGDMAADCQLDPPEPEDEEDQRAKREICNRDKPHHEPDGCWKVVHHYSRCSCTYRAVDEWEEQEPAPCEGFTSGAQVGWEERFDGFTDCDDDGEDLTDPEFYKEHCCKEKPASIGLPRCRRTWSKYAGGARIENGPEHWKNIYGDNVVLHAVTPKQGYCGDLLREYNVPQKNCCEGVPELKPDPDNPTHIWPNSNYLIRVEGGKNGAERVWSSSGGGVTFEGGVTKFRTLNNMAKIYVDQDVCPQTTIRVDDGCSVVEILLEGPDSDGPNLDDDDLTVQPGAQIVLGANGGVPPFMWQVGGGLILEGWSKDGKYAYIRAPEDEDWCMGEVTVVDVCGRSDTCYVRNGKTGKWVQQYDFDQCNPPGAPFEPQNPLYYSGTSKPNGEYYVEYVTSERTSTNTTGNCPAPRTSWTCPRRGGYVVNVDYRTLCANGAGNLGYEYEEGCCKQKSSTQSPGLIRYGLHTTTNHATRLYKWICLAT